MAGGPNPNFIEPGAPPGQTAGGFYAAEVGMNTVGTVDAYAAGKSSAFPGEGGPAVIVVEVPEAIARQAGGGGRGDYAFLPGQGLEALLAVWEYLPKRIR
jgi:hypothetical protein